MKLYFVRHGQTEFNQVGKIQGGTVDSPLTLAGIEGARHAGKRLANVTFDQVYASPQKRAKDTALYIMAENKDTNPPAIIEESKFRELAFGQWEGRLITEVQGEAQYHYLKKQPERYDPQHFHGESYQQLVKRSRQALSEVIAKQPEAANLLIVSHGITLTTLIKALEGKGQKDYRESGLLDNTSISIIETQDRGQSYELITYNS